MLSVDFSCYSLGIDILTTANVTFRCFLYWLDGDRHYFELMKRTFSLLLLLGISLIVLFDAEAGFIQSVTTSKSFFNPTNGETCQIKIDLKSVGKLSLIILDRDGYIVRTLADQKDVGAGLQSLDWDGKDDLGQIVADEAYSLKLNLNSNGSNESYFPANKDLEDIQPAVNYYDRQNGIFSYKLSKPARVHAQAGSAKVDPKTGKGMGPVMKTIVNREPRSAGAIVEQWNGYDESNSIYLPNLPNFVTSVAATALPENSIITVGNSGKKFIEVVASRTGKSLFSYIPKTHHHHQGLNTLEDLSPSMTLKPLNAEWDAKKEAWIPKSTTLMIQGTITGPSAKYFTEQPGEIWFYVNGEVSGKIENPKKVFEVKVLTDKLPSGTHIVSVNWGSEYGPTSANSIRILLTKENASLIKVN
jgi:hypothetical protein